VRLRLNVAVSLVAISAIAWGFHFAFAQERRRTHQYLQEMCQELNKQFFQNTLPNTWIEWADLDADAGRTIWDGDDDTFIIQVDRRANFWSEDELRDSVQHEVCHVATWKKDQDAHGPSWVACMSRIQTH